MRQTYETSEDRGREVTSADVIAKRFRCKVIHIKKFHCADYVLTRNGRIVAIAEIKHRSISRNEHPEFMLSAKKLADCQLMARETGVPFLLFVKWSDYFGYLMVTDETKFLFRMGGRRDRGDDADYEPCVWFKVADFKEVA